jgi:hypothetical protein
VVNPAVEVCEDGISEAGIEIESQVEIALATMDFDRNGVSSEVISLIKLALIRMLAGQVSRDAAGRLVVKSDEAAVPLSDWLKDPSHWQQAMPARDAGAAQPAGAITGAVTQNVTNLTVQTGTTPLQIAAYIAIGTAIGVMVVMYVRSRKDKRRSRKQSTRKKPRKKQPRKKPSS